MAVSATIEATPPFVTGANVGAYRASAFPGPGPQPGVPPPIGAVVQTSAVDAGGKLTFTGLLPSTSYVAGALVAGAWRYIRFTTDMEVTAGTSGLGLSSLVSVTDGQSTGAGEGALEALLALPFSAERLVHSSNTAFGWHALQALSGLTAVLSVTAPTGAGGTTIQLTGIEAAAGAIWAGGNSNTPIIVFRKVSAGVTTPAANVPYYVVGGTANSFKLAATPGGVPIPIVGGTVGTQTEVALLASAEDNTAVGSQAGLRITTGGGNTLVGENAGVNITSGEESTVVGCEAGQAQQTAGSMVALGFRALNKSTVGGNVAVGTQAMELSSTSVENVAVGHKAMQLNTTGSKNVALGFEAMRNASTAGSNVAVGDQAGKALTGGGENVLVGLGAAAALTTGSENVAIGTSALSTSTVGKGNVAVGSAALLQATGNKNVAVGIAAGLSCTGSSNIFIGNEAGEAAGAVSNKLYIDVTNTATPLILGDFATSSLTLSRAGGKVGLYGVAPVAQAAAIASPAETLAALKTAVDGIRAAIKGVGITA